LDEIINEKRDTILIELTLIGIWIVPVLGFSFGTSFPLLWKIWVDLGVTGACIEYWIVRLPHNWTKPKPRPPAAEVDITSANSKKNESQALEYNSKWNQNATELLDHLENALEPEPKSTLLNDLQFSTTNLWNPQTEEVRATVGKILDLILAEFPRSDLTRKQTIVNWIAYLIPHADADTYELIKKKSSGFVDNLYLKDSDFQENGTVIFLRQRFRDYSRDFMSSFVEEALDWGDDKFTRLHSNVDLPYLLHNNIETFKQIRTRLLEISNDSKESEQRRKHGFQWYKEIK
jgi:hypothetical protein